MLPFPNNPTGAIMERKDLEEIAEVIKKHDIFVISDEIYSELCYTDQHVSIANIDRYAGENHILINGFSKSYAMTGWRLGYACGPAGDYRADDQDSSVLHYVCTDNITVCSCGSS